MDSLCFMIHFIYGQDEDRARERINKLISDYEKKHSASGVQKSVWDVSGNWDAKELNYFLQSPSLFNENKLFILKGVFLIKASDLLTILKDSKLADEKDVLGLVVSSCNKEACLKKDKDLWFFLNQKPNNVEEFALLQNNSLNKWVQNKISDYNLKISSSAVRKLIFYCDNNSQRISQELDKLVCYEAQKAGLITEDDIEKMVAKHENISSFSIVDAVSERHKGRAIYLLHKFSAGGEDFNLLFGALVYQFKNLMIIRDLMDEKVIYSEIAKKLNLHPFVLQKSYGMASRFKVQELKSIYNKLSELELGVKFGKYDVGDAIFDFILML